MVSDEYQDKISSNNNYYIPQNVPAGAIPLRIPIQNRGKIKFAFKLHF